MNPRDRLIAALTGGTADRVPLSLPEYRFVRTREDVDALKDPAKREIASRVFDRGAAFLRFDSHVNRNFCTPPQFIREARREQIEGKVRVTYEIDTPKGKLTNIVEWSLEVATRWTVKYPVESLEDIEKIRSLRWELPAELCTPDLSDLPTNFHERCLTRTGISSPVICAAGMMPYEYFLMLCATEPNLVRELAIECKNRLLKILDVLLADRNIDYLWMGGCEWLTPPMGRPEMYAEFIQPHEAELIARAHAAGSLVHVHCHGNMRSTLEMVIERGGDYVEPMEPPPDGDMTMAEAKDLAAGRITLGGSIEARLIECESADVVEQAVRAAFEGGKHRMILTTTAGPIDRMSPTAAENYHRLIDVWEELSPVEPCLSAPGRPESARDERS